MELSDCWSLGVIYSSETFIRFAAFLFGQDKYGYGSDKLHFLFLLLYI